MGVISSGWSFAPKLFNPQLFKQIMLPPPRKKYTKKESFFNKTGSQFGFVGGTKQVSKSSPRSPETGFW
jgi:hypothetical protein